jgi:peptidoglycan/LPS O-acetylase OafA/YrhL
VTPGGTRSQTLDVLRAVAVLLVIVAHTKGPRAREPDVVEFAWQIVQRGGWSGVDLFFVLSGFLVGGLLLVEQREHGRLRIGRFLVRRGLRIYPAFYVYVAFTIAAALFFGKKVPLERVLAECLFVQNYWRGVWWGHTWSLAVEEHFYVLLPLLLVALTAFNARRGRPPFSGLVAVFVFVAIGCLALRVQGAFTTKYWHRADVYPTHLRIDSLLFGVVLAWAWHVHGDVVRPLLAKHGRVLALLGALLVLPIFFVPIQAPWVHSFGFTLLSLGYGAIVLGLVAAWTPQARAWRLLAMIGRHSYSIYLWHRVVVVLGRGTWQKWLGHRPSFLVEVAVTTTGAIILGIVMSKLIELPALRLRDRWFPSPARTPPPADASSPAT